LLKSAAIIAKKLGKFCRQMPVLTSEKNHSVQLPTTPDNVTLLAFAAERRAAGRPAAVAVNRSISLSCLALSSKPAAAACGSRMMAWLISLPTGCSAAKLLHTAAAVNRWDRQTNAVPLNRSYRSVKNIIIKIKSILLCSNKLTKAI